MIEWIHKTFINCLKLKSESFLVCLSIKGPISSFEEKEVGAMPRVDLWQTQEATKGFWTMDLGWYLTTFTV